MEYYQTSVSRMVVLQKYFHAAEGQMEVVEPLQRVFGSDKYLQV